MSQKPAGGGAAPRGGGTAGAGAWQAPPPPLKDARVGSGAAAAGTPKALGVVASAGSGALPTETIALEVHRTALTMTARQHLQRLVSQLLEAEQVEWPEVWQPIIEVNK